MTRTATGSATLYCVPWHKCSPPDVLLPLAHWVRIGKGGEASCLFLTDVDAEKQDSLRILFEPGLDCSDSTLIPS
jgi:hypothetical protein